MFAKSGTLGCLSSDTNNKYKLYLYTTIIYSVYILIIQKLVFSAIIYLIILFNPLRLLNVLKRIKNKSRSYYKTFPNVLENTTRHSVFSNLLRNPSHAHSIASIVIFDNRIKQFLTVVKNIYF